MTTKIFCDACGEEIQQVSLPEPSPPRRFCASFYYSDRNTITADLCGECKEELYYVIEAWIVRKNPIVKQAKAKERYD